MATRAKKSTKAPKADDGTDPKEATAWRYSQLRSLGIGVDEGLPQWKAIKAIAALRACVKSVEAVAKEFGFVQWERTWPSKGQRGLMWVKGIHNLKINACRCPRDANLLITAKLEPQKFRKLMLADLKRSRSNEEITAIALDLAWVQGSLDEAVWAELEAAGKQRRAEVSGGIPE